MKILIIGSGKVGYTLAESLTSKEHDVTVIDNHDEALSEAAEKLDVMLIKGSGASLSTLKQAGAEHADIVIATTRSDEVNMLCCILAKKLGVKHAIARVRDPEYVRDIDLFKRQLDIDLVINPERSTASEILRLLRFPAAVEIDTLNRGRTELIGFRVTSGDRISGVTLAQLRKKVKSPVIVCMVERGDDVHIPRGDFIIEEGDLAFVAGRFDDITKFFREIGRATHMASNVMIIGGGRTTHYLAHMASMIGIKSVIIERNEEECARLAENLPHATIIHGDGLDQELLESENIRGMDALAALTNMDEDNLIISLYANHAGVPKVVTKSNHHNYAPLVKNLGIDSVVSPRLITANRIMHFVRGLSGSRGGAARALYSLLGGRVEAIEFVVSRDTRYIGEKIKDMPIKPGVTIVSILRGGDSITPGGSDFFLEGDSAVIVTAQLGFDELNDIFER